MAYGAAVPPAPPMDGPTGDEGPPPSQTPYAKAGRTIRHALADQDDEAIGRAVCDLVRYENAHGEPDGDEGPEEDMGGPKKPNLALILASKGKKD